MIAADDDLDGPMVIPVSDTLHEPFVHGGMYHFCVHDARMLEDRLNLPPLS